MVAMKDLSLAMSNAVETLTGEGAPFALGTAEIDGVLRKTYTAAPRNLADFFRLMLEHGDKECVVYRHERYTFREAYANSSALAHALLKDFAVAKGDRVAIVSRNNPEWIISFAAVLSVGAVAVPMNAWWTTEELDYGLRDCGAKVIVADRQRIERLVPLVDELGLKLIAVDDCSGLDVSLRQFGEVVAPYTRNEMPTVDVSGEDYATILYTSGSTGHPKGAVSTHRAIIAAVYSWMLMVQASKSLVADAAPEAHPASSLLTIPLFHCTASHSVYLMSLITGRKLVMMHKWDVDEAMRLIEEERITFFTGVPTMSAELQEAATTSERDLSSLSEVYAGGAARPPAQVEKIAETFTNSVVGIGYGLTETNALGTVNSGEVYLAKPGSAGVTVPAVTTIEIFDEADNPLRIGERGEICIHSTANAVGYWNNPDATSEAFHDGWFRTGDVGYFDEDGFLYIVDRMKEIIIRAGENISCIEVEAAIYRHPDVGEAAVYGVPDNRMGEAVAASVVPKAGRSIDEEELRNFLKAHIAGFKVPSYFLVQEAPLPRIASGKIYKRKLKADLREKLSSTS